MQCYRPLLLQDPGPPGLFQPRWQAQLWLSKKKIWLLSAIRQNDTFTRLLWTSSHRNFIKGLCSLTFLILPGCLWYTIYHYYFHRNKWQEFITILENSCYVFKPIFDLVDKIGLLILLKKWLRIFPFHLFSTQVFEAIKGIKKVKSPKATDEHSLWLGSAQLSSTQLSSLSLAQLSLAQLGLAQLISAWFSSAHLSLAQLVSFTSFFI